MQPKFRSVVKKMEARELYIHPSAQRLLVPTKLKRLMEDMDLDAIGVLHAVQYAIDGKDGTWIIDGQHRVMALVKLGFGEWVVEVKIHLDVTDDKRACALFLKLNDRSPVSPYDKFENEVRAGLPEAVGVVDVVKANGIKLGRTSGDGLVCAVSGLKEIYKVDAGKSLSSTLRVITESWGTRAAGLEGKVIAGVSTIITRYNGKVDLPALVSTLSKYPGGPSSLLGSARGLTETSKAPLVKCVAQVIINQYNHRRRSGQLDPA